MEIRKYKNFSQEKREAALTFASEAQKVMGWYTLSLITHVEDITAGDEYGSRFIFLEGNIIGMFIISDKEGYDELSSNLSHLAGEDEVYWFCSFYLLPEHRGSVMLLNALFQYIKHLSESKSVYTYTENKRLEKIISKRLKEVSCDHPVFQMEKGTNLKDIRGEIFQGCSYSQK